MSRTGQGEPARVIGHWRGEPDAWLDFGFYGLSGSRALGSVPLKKPDKYPPIPPRHPVRAYDKGGAPVDTAVELNTMKPVY